METVLWPDRQEFLGYHMTMKAMSRDEAIALWNKDSADPAIEKRGTGSGLRVKVMGIPTSNIITGKRAEGRVDASRVIGNKSELESAAKRLCVGTVSEDYDMLFGRSGRTGSVSASGPLSDMPVATAAMGAPRLRRASRRYRRVRALLTRAQGTSQARQTSFSAAAVAILRAPDFFQRTGGADLRPEDPVLILLSAAGMGMMVSLVMMMLMLIPTTLDVMMSLMLRMGRGRGWGFR